MRTAVGHSANTQAPAARPELDAHRKKKSCNSTPLASCYHCPAATNRLLPINFHPARGHMIRKYAKKWINGTTLHYYFFNHDSDGPEGSWVGSAPQKAIIRRAFCEWKDIGIGLDFQEVSNREEAEIRIGLADAEESWSILGRDAIDVASDPDERTMNFGADLTSKAGWNMALTEIGRALGFSQSDQDISPPMDWDKTIENAQQVYPPMTRFVETELKLLESIPLRVSPGEQRDIRIRPLLSRTYTIQMVGRSDVVMVLFEDVGGLDLFEEMDRELEYVAGDDDSGEDRSARLITRLCRDREYILRVRVHYSSAKMGAAVLLS